MTTLSFLKTEATEAALRAEAEHYGALAAMLEELALLPEACCALSFGCLAVRLEVDEGDYAFYLPEPYKEQADAEAALCALEAYALREELPLVLTDLSAEDCDALRLRYAHAEICELPVAGRFLLCVQTEADALDALPTLRGARVTLRAPDPSDAAAYGALCRNTEHLCYFGYSDLSDLPEATDRTLVERRLDEWERRCSLPFFIYHAEAFVGELTLFGFDGRGGAELSLRLLPEACGGGLATDAMRTAIAFARELGLTHLRARTHPDNLPCRRMLDRLFGEGTPRDGERHYRLALRD